METRAHRPRTLIIPVLFAFACVAVSLITWHSFGGAVPFQAKGYEVVVPLPRATNLYAGSDVEIAGVKIGHVVGVRQTGNSSAVTVELQDPYSPLHTGATAIARTKTLLGEGYIELAPGPRSDPMIPDGGRISPSHVLPSQQLDQFLQTFSPSTRQRLREMFAGLARAVQGRATDINDDVAGAATATASLSNLTQSLDSQRAELGQLIDNSGRVLAAVGQREGDVQAAVDAGDSLFTATAQRNEALSATIRALPPFLVQLNRTSTAFSSASGDLGRAAATLEPDAPLLAPGLLAVDRAVPKFQTLFHQLPPVIAAGRRGLPALTRIVRAVGTSFPQVYPALRQFIPLLQLTAADRDQLVSFFANVAQLSNISYIGPGGKSLRGVGAIPSTWNETLSGWVKRLPSNRMNPYPKPRSALEIASGGLRAYDCRNLGNPDYLPPTGTGAPPCLTQGPWTFNGRSAYYPRLLLAPK